MDCAPQYTRSRSPPQCKSLQFSNATLLSISTVDRRPIYCSIYCLVSPSLRPNPFRPLHLPHMVDILHCPMLRIYAPAQRHSGDLDKHLELRCETTINARGRGEPLRDALQGPIEEPRADPVSERDTGPLRLGHRWRGLGKGEGMREVEDQVGEQGDGAILGDHGCQHIYEYPANIREKEEK